MIPILFVIGGFFLGSIPFGFLIARAKGIDITREGSGNIGATNVLRVLGKGPGLLVFALDVLKGWLPAFLAARMTGSSEWAFGAGVAAVLGHSFSPFLGFKGGKGIATGFGALLGSAPFVGFTVFAGFCVAMTATLMVSFSSLVAALALPFAGWFYREPVSVIVAYAIAGIVIIARHEKNIRRIAKGTEPIIGQKSGEPRGDTRKPRLIAALLSVVLIVGIVLAYPR